MFLHEIWQWLDSLGLAVAFIIGGLALLGYDPVAWCREIIDAFSDDRGHRGPDGWERKTPC